MDVHLTRFCTEVGLDLITLAQLHDRELTEATIEALRQDGFPRNLGFGVQSEVAQQAEDLLESALRTLGPSVAELDDLAADFASIYLTHNYGASPCESVWLDEDGLAMQRPMFEVRECYARHGFSAADWRKRPDDHLVYQLQFLVALIEHNRLESLAEAARFLDQHTLRWLPAFAQRVAARSETPFYAGLAMFSAGYLDEIRDVLAQILGEARPSAEEIEQRARVPKEEPLPMPTSYVPGSSPSW